MKNIIFITISIAFLYNNFFIFALLINKKKIYFFNYQVVKEVLFDMQKKIADKNNYYIRSKECHIKIYNFKIKTKKLKN